MWQSFIVTEQINAGELITLDEAANRLGLSVGKVRRLIEEHDLITIADGKERKVPAHLIKDKETLHGLRGTIILLLDCGLTIGEIVQWLYTDNENLQQHEGTPMAALLAGHKSPVRRAAQMLAI